MRIGELSRQTGITRSRIRFYEKRGLLTPVTRSANGYRRYEQRDVKVLAFIDRARRLGFSLKEIGVFLADYAGTSSAPARLVTMLEDKLSEIDAHIAAARERRGEIAALLKDLRQ